MKINDLRFKKEELSWEQLQAGSVYIDSYHGIYILATDHDEMVINLASGFIYHRHDYPTGSVFTLVDVTMEIR